MLANNADWCGHFRLLCREQAFTAHASAMLPAVVLVANHSGQLQMQYAQLM